MNLINHIAHYVVGLLAILSIKVSFIICPTIIFLFWRYEVNEEKNLQRMENRLDASFEEFRGCLIGMCIGTVLLLVEVIL